MCHPTLFSRELIGTHFRVHTINPRTVQLGINVFVVVEGRSLQHVVQDILRKRRGRLAGGVIDGGHLGHDYHGDRRRGGNAAMEAGEKEGEKQKGTEVKMEGDGRNIQRNILCSYSSPSFHSNF